MKTVILIVTICILSFGIFSQDENIEAIKRWKFGFNIGVNYSNLLVKETLPSYAALSNAVGLQTGILVDYQVSKKMSIAPKVELVFNNGGFDYTSGNGETINQIMRPRSLDFMTHFNFKATLGNLKSYFYVGPNIKIPLVKNTNSTSSFSTNTDFAIDFGVGIDKKNKNFHFCPEFRYSVGLINVNTNPTLRSVKFHSLSLILNIFD